MKRSEFTLLLATDRTEAVRLVLDHKVDLLLNEGRDELKRVLSIWAGGFRDGCMPTLLMGDDSLLVEMAIADGLIDDSPAEPPLGAALTEHFRELIGTAGVFVNEHMQELLDNLAAAIDENEAPNEQEDEHAG